MPPKSILKQTPPPASAPPAVRAANPRHLQVALHHANVLEQRKRVEAEVLDAILALMDCPTAPDADATRPSAADARFFREAVVPFQPSDYDALIEERNITDKCGYALCARPPKRARSTARKQFVDTAHGVEIVDRKTLEVWCSDDCARRALYVKVQLSEDPVWMRQGEHGGSIELMVENADEHARVRPLRAQPDLATAPAAADGDKDDVDDAWAARDDAMQHLALERGEKAGQVSKANTDLVKDQITERMPAAAPQPPSLLQISDHTMAIEGHVPRINRKDAADEDEDDPQDWDKHLPG
jgi:hypothetical protein